MHAAELGREDISTYLARHQRKELLRFLTCGSVDDGAISRSARSEGTSSLVSGRA